MKSIWNGSLSFGLVTIDVQLFSAVKAHALGFKILCGTCKQPLAYERWCKHCNKEIPWTDTVKGLEIKKNSFFVINQETLESLRLEKTDLINIVEFVDVALISPIYYEKHYYVVPSKKNGHKAYYLFQHALEIANKAAIGTFVMRDREHLCAINAYQAGLLLSTLNYSYEILSLENILESKAIPKVTDAQLKLAQQLINQLTVKKFDISPYKDSFAVNLAMVIKKGKGLIAVEKPNNKRNKSSKNADNLLDTLKASLEIHPKKLKKTKKVTA